jgi:hypothetical protein
MELPLEQAAMKDFFLNVTRYPRYLVAFGLGVANFGAGAPDGPGPQPCDRRGPDRGRGEWDCSAWG